jgi:hypothetical protein
MTTAAATAALGGRNPHPRDAHIHFEEGPHKYTIQGINGVTADTEFTSVTTFVHGHFEHFNAKEVIAAMMGNTKKWNDPVANAKYYGKTAEEIEEMWSKAGRDAAAKGTEMHYKIECFYNDVDTAETDTASATPPELAYFKNFHNEHVAGEQATLRPYRTEWTVFHEEAQIAGSIDMVYEVITTTATTTDPDPSKGGGTPKEHIPIDSAVNSYLRSIPNPSNVVPSQGDGPPLAIYDWKRCRDIVKTNRGNKFATHPAIEHLPDTNYWHYALQLNIYKYILQTKYDKTVTDLYLVVLHPEAQNYQRVKLPDLQAEVAELFEERIRRFAATATATAN